MESNSEIPTTRLLIRNRIANVGKKAAVQIERVKTEWHNSEESITNLANPRENTRYSTHGSKETRRAMIRVNLSSEGKP